MIKDGMMTTVTLVCALDEHNPNEATEKTLYISKYVVSFVK